MTVSLNQSANEILALPHVLVAERRPRDEAHHRRKPRALRYLHARELSAGSQATSRGVPAVCGDAPQ